MMRMEAAATVMLSALTNAMTAGTPPPPDSVAHCLTRVFGVLIQHYVQGNDTLQGELESLVKLCREGEGDELLAMLDASERMALSGFLKTLIVTRTNVQGVMHGQTNG